VNTMSPSTAHAYIDESGAKGLLRNLTLDRDDEIAVMAAIIIHDSIAAGIKQQLEIPHNLLKAQTPQQDKLHITDAFSSSNDKWIAAAITARAEIERILISNKIPIIYSARRLKLSRILFEMAQQMVDAAREFHKTTTPNIGISNHMSEDRVEGEVFTHLILKLDAYGKDSNMAMIPHIDNTIDAIHQHYCEQLNESRNISQNTTTHQAFDILNKKKLTGTISLSVYHEDGRLAKEFDTTHVINPIVESDVTPEILAADVVTNSIFSHLSGLVQPLNAPNSIANWNLSSLVTANVPNDNFDIL